MSEERKHSTRKPNRQKSRGRNKAIQPPLTLKSREVVINKGRQELYNTWLTHLSRRIKVSSEPSHTVQSLLTQSPLPQALETQVRTAFAELQVKKTRESNALVSIPDLEILKTAEDEPATRLPADYGPL